MVKPLKSLAKPDARTLRELAGADPSIPPAVMPSTGSEVVNFRVAFSVVDQLDCAGFRIPQPDLEDRTPRRRRDRREAA